MCALSREMRWRDIEQRSFTVLEFATYIRDMKVKQLELMGLSTLNVPGPSRQQLRTIKAYIEAVRVETPGTQTSRRLEVCLKTVPSHFIFSPLVLLINSP